MPSKTSKKKPAATLPSIPKEIIDQFVSGPMTAEAVNTASMAFKKALIERALGAELSHHLGYSPGADKPADAGNHRNGVSGKTVLTDDGPLRIHVPRDRAGSFEPVLIPKHERRFTGFDDKIVAMYARGMTMREIQGFLLEQYGTEVSAEFISSVTDAVMAEVTAAFARYEDALVNNNIYFAQDVLVMEENMDRFLMEYMGSIEAIMKQDPKNVRRGINLLFITRCLERIGDLTTNVAEDIVFYMNAKDIRHSHPEGEEKPGSAG